MHPLPFPRPFVSFILATRNRAPILLHCLHKTLAHARAALGDSHFNIHIIDNASTDDTLTNLNEIAGKNHQIKIHPRSKNGGPVAKNIALHQNPADILVLLDDDAYPNPGALSQMVRHFQDDPTLGAAVFDVTLPDGHKEASAFPDVFIGAGTALRGTALRKVAESHNHMPGKGLLPADFFMQAEEYDLSFRLLDAGWSIQRFWDMPLTHLKTPGARIGTRTTQLDVRNNLWLLARYIPQPMAGELAAEWMARYWRMAVGRDVNRVNDAVYEGTTHKAAFLRGAAEGLLHWKEQRGVRFLSANTLERVFKFDLLCRRLARVKEQLGLQRIVFAEWGKNMLAYHRAAQALDLEVVAIMDTNGPGEYRGIPIISENEISSLQADAVVLTAMSRVHAERRAAALRRVVQVPVVDLLHATGQGVSQAVGV